MMKVLRSFQPTWDGLMASESRRDLILAAMIRVVGSKGYKETSVADVIEEAGTSRTTFYK
ncbi:MAG: TetR/AcrR family transcriptional regulator, partial [Thermoleophilia bacterium]